MRTLIVSCLLGMSLAGSAGLAGSASGQPAQPLNSSAPRVVAEVPQHAHVPTALSLSSATALPATHDAGPLTVFPFGEDIVDPISSAWFALDTPAIERVSLSGWDCAASEEDHIATKPWSSHFADRVPKDAGVAAIPATALDTAVIRINHEDPLTPASDSVADEQPEEFPNWFSLAFPTVDRGALDVWSSGDEPPDPAPEPATRPQTPATRPQTIVVRQQEYVVKASSAVVETSQPKAELVAAESEQLPEEVSVAQDSGPLDRPAGEHTHRTNGKQSGSCQNEGQLSPAACVCRQHSQSLPRGTRHTQCYCPECFVVAPPGSSLYGHIAAQIGNGLAERMVLYRYDFLDSMGNESVSLSPRGHMQLDKIIKRWECGNLGNVDSVPICIESTGQPRLDEQRRLHVIAVLGEWGATFAPEMVVVCHPRAFGLQGVEAAIIHGNMIRNTATQGRSIMGNGASGGGSQSQVGNIFGGFGSSSP